MAEAQVRRELVAFLIVGGLTVLIDFLTYTIFLFAIALSAFSSKALGFIVGMIFAYFANKAITFRSTDQKPGSVPRFAMLYSTSLTVNVTLNELLLRHLPSLEHVVYLSFIIATGGSTILNFIGMKFFVFQRSSAVP